MRNLIVSIEINGKEQYVGNITGNTADDACFCYAKDYIDHHDARSISISLPIQEQAFSPQNTRNFFEGLLPEGFSRRAVATWMHVDENDYLTILAKLGQECIGAVRIVEENVEHISSGYIKLSSKQVKALAAEGAMKSTELLMESHLSLAGASGKVGLYYSEKDNAWYQPLGDAPSTHIVKQSHVRLDKLVINEQLCLKTARAMGIDVPESFVVNIGQGYEDDILFAIKRYDRAMDSDIILSGLKRPLRIHQEDFAQALHIPSSEKYEKNRMGYMKRMFECLRKYSSNPIEDQLKLWDRIIFNYFIGNTDCHVKNFSLLYDKSLNGIRLAPAYDIVSTRIYALTKEMSFHIGGDYNIDEIGRDSFQRASREIGFGEKMAMDRFDHIAEGFEPALSEAADEMADCGLTDAIEIRERILKTKNVK